MIESNSEMKYTQCTLKLRPVKLRFVIFGHLIKLLFICEPNGLGRWTFKLP